MAGVRERLQLEDPLDGPLLVSLAHPSPLSVGSGHGVFLLPGVNICCTRSMVYKKRGLQIGSSHNFTAFLINHTTCIMIMTTNYLVPIPDHELELDTPWNRQYLVKK